MRLNDFATLGRARGCRSALESGLPVAPCIVRAPGEILPFQLIVETGYFPLKAGRAGLEGTALGPRGPPLRRAGAPTGRLIGLAGEKNGQRQTQQNTQRVPLGTRRPRKPTKNPNPRTPPLRKIPGRGSSAFRSGSAATTENEASTNRLRTYRHWPGPSPRRATRNGGRKTPPPGS